MLILARVTYVMYTTSYVVQLDGVLEERPVSMTFPKVQSRRPPCMHTTDWRQIRNGGLYRLQEGYCIARVRSCLTGLAGFIILSPVTVSVEQPLLHLSSSLDRLQ